MAALTANDVAVSIAQGNRDIGGVHSSKNISVSSVAFGDASKTYPANGVPLPAIGVFGFYKGLNFVSIQPPPGDGFVYKYDSTNHTIRIYTQGFRTGATAAASNENGALVKNSLGVEGVPRIPNTAANTTYDMGQMIELPTGTAVPATSLVLLVVGE